MTVLGETLAGWGLGGGQPVPENPHGVFIHNEILPLLAKLQKELRLRRSKVRRTQIVCRETWEVNGASHPRQEMHTSLQEAVLAMRGFQNEAWPPTGDNPLPQSPARKQPTAEDQSQATDSTVEMESPTALTPSSPTLPHLHDEDDDDMSVHPGNPTQDNPQTREPVHPAVIAMLDALILILHHPSKTSKACELALEGVDLLVGKRYVSGRAGGKDDASGSGGTHQEGEEADPPSLLHRLLEALSKTSDSTDQAVQTALLRTLTTIVTSPKCGVHEGSMLLALRTTFHVYLVTKSGACQQTAKSALLDMLRSVVSRMEAYDVIGPSVEVQQSEDSAFFISQYHTDTYVLFRSLCKLSSKDLPADTQDDQAKRLFLQSHVPTDPLALRSKILSLELILAVLDYSGPAFLQEKFVYLVQHYLCVSLLKNCMSQHTQIAFLSQKIFLLLVYKFKGHLKQEIEIFLSNIFLKVLESQNSSFKQKALVLESLRSLANDPVLLTQIFLNYDCDLDAMNLYKDMVHMLTKLSGKATGMGMASNLSAKERDEEQQVSLAAMEVLVSILKAFLRAMGLPGGEDDGSDDTAGSKIRGMLQLDVGLAARPPDNSSMHSRSDNSTDRAPLDGDDKSSARSSNVADRIVDAFEQKRNQEQNFEIGSVKFTLSLKNGLNFFIDNEFVKRDASEIAVFFLENKDRLDKTQIGEVLGKEPDAVFVKGDGIDAEKGGAGFFVRILHHYVGALDFTDMLFDEAIRLFLAGFRLPGEAQKIDRIMEKFAEKYVLQNPETFTSADTAFILAFSVIMLQTDLHNPSIKEERKMTVESFISNNRGIGENGSSLPDDFLTAIYNRIKDRPFSLKEDDAARDRVGAQKQIFDTSVFFEGSTLFGTTAEERKRENFKKEKEDLMTATQHLMKRRPGKQTKAQSTASTSLMDSIAPADVVKPMFDVTWGPIIGIFSQILECSDDERSVTVCLNGFVYAVRVAARSNMSLARDTFISSLAKFTFLGSIKEMRKKNVESIRTLLSISVIDGEYLGESWGPVLQCISQLARLRLSASGLDADESFLVDSTAKSSRDAIFGGSRMDLGKARVDATKEAEESNGRAVLEAVQEVLIDKVFSSSVNLSAKSLAHFIDQLIAVSQSEIGGSSRSGTNASGRVSEASGSHHGRTNSSNHGAPGPSIFSLQKLVEVADYNMDVRPRLVWAQVWEMMADYFAKIACHDNAMVSVFAIDSLKQLSFKFLDKPELAEFNFQRLFLQPFLVVMEDKGSREDVREMVLRCIDNIIRTKSHNLRSGWKVVFSILHRSASDPCEKIDYLGLAILQRLLDEHLHELSSLTDGKTEPIPAEKMTPVEKRARNSHVDDFVGLCKASLSFVQKEESDSPRPMGLSMRAFCHSAIYADLLASKRVLPPVSGAQSDDRDAPGFTYSGLSDEEALEMVMWHPLIDGLSDCLRSSIKSSAGGVGCLVQRGSILALRSILLRHGHLFSGKQLKAILEQSLLPAIQVGAEGDTCAVVGIVSESPTVSSIDFLVEPLPLPPSPGDFSLLRFEALNTTPTRTMGTAELMLEASFTDLRHGGDGDLRRAYILAKKASTSQSKPAELPFPDSWIATTAPVALGLVTDVITELVMPLNERGIDMWPSVANLYRTWCIGKDDAWQTCEALVRISCREVQRLSERLSKRVQCSPDKDTRIWVQHALALAVNLLSSNLVLEDALRTSLRQSSFVGDVVVTEERERVSTPFGMGTLICERTAAFSSSHFPVVVQEIQLPFGGTLFSPILQSSATETRAVVPRGTNDVPIEVDGEYRSILLPFVL